jgi:hypothetical protein
MLVLVCETILYDIPEDSHTIICKGTVVPLHAKRHTQGAEVQLHRFLNLALDGDEWLASYTDALSMGKEPPVPTD